MFEHNTNNAEAYRIVEDTPQAHKARLSHELIAGAAAYEAAKAYNEHCEKNGKPATHAKAKELLAALSGGIIDRLIETKGLDFIDHQKVKREVHDALSDASASHY